MSLGGGKREVVVGESLPPQKKRQNTLVFKTQLKRESLLNVPLGPLMDAMLQESELRQSAMRKGYIVKNVRSFPIIVTVCEAAKANWPRAEREKAQKTVDEMPPNMPILLKRPLPIK